MAVPTGTIRFWLALGALVVGTVFAAPEVASAGVAGGKNYAWRKARCENTLTERASYNLPTHTFSWEVRILDVDWVPGNYVVKRGQTWERAGRGGVCVMKWSRNGGPEKVVFHDGCSGQALGRPSTNSVSATTWGQLFHPACVYHDHCYHHEPSTSGKSQKFCDDRMRSDMYRICDAEYRTKAVARTACKKAAATMYSGLRAGGGKHYRFNDTRLPYAHLYKRK